MDEDKNLTSSTTSGSTGSTTGSTGGSTSEGGFDPNNLDNKEESSRFSITTKYKWVLALSILILIAGGIMIYAYIEGALAAEVWQVAIWGVGVLLAIYSIVSKSLGATLINLILFAGVSMIPAWGQAYEFFRPVIELFTGAK